MTCLAHMFMRLRALMSFGLSKLCALEKLSPSAARRGAAGEMIVPVEAAAVDADYDPCVLEE